MDGGVGDFELVCYGDRRVYVATGAACGKSDTESVSRVALGGGYLLICLLFDGETAEELGRPAMETDRSETACVPAASVCVCVYVCETERERACLGGSVRGEKKGREG